MGPAACALASLAAMAALGCGAARGETVHEAALQDPPSVPRAAAVRPLPGVEIGYDLLSAEPDLAASPGRLRGRLAVPRGQLHASLLFHPAAGDGMHVARLDTRWQGQMPGVLQNVVLGDTVGSGGGWSRPVRYAGLRFGRALAVRPGFDTSPQAQAAGQAALPSAGYAMARGNINGQPATHPEVQALLDSDGPAGGLAVGRPGPLAAGASDYEVEAGRLRTGWGTADDAYGDGYAAAAYRFGLTESLTAEARAEWTSRHTAVGFEVSQAWGDAGSVHAMLAQSHAAQSGGLRWGLGWMRNAEGATWALDWEASERGFSTLAAAPEEMPTRERISASAGMPLPRNPWGQASAELRFERHSRWGEPVGSTFNLAAHLSLAERSRLSLTLVHRSDDQPGWHAGLTLAVPLESGLP